MARDRDDDEYDDDDDDRPRRRRRRDDDDDYDDRGRNLGPLDKMFRDTNIVVLVIFGVCCGLIAFVLGLIGMLTAKNAKAKSNATLVVIISGAIQAIAFVIGFINGIAGGAGRVPQ